MENDQDKNLRKNLDRPSAGTTIDRRVLLAPWSRS